MMNNSILTEVLNLMMVNQTDEVFGCARYSVFNTKSNIESSAYNTESNIESDYKITLYDREGVKLLVCHECGYFEILGLDDYWYNAIVQAFDSCMKLYGYEERMEDDFFDEEEEDWDDIDDGYSSNCHCDTYGFCGGTSCPQYWQCHSNN